MKLSIIIPAYNEEDTIADVVKEVIVVNDASTDKTLKILTNLKNKGHAETVVRGLKSAKGTYVFYEDSDNQMKLSTLDFDLISGYRVHRQDKLFRKVVSLILRLVIFVRHGYYIRDANCPFKVFKRSSLRLLMKELPKGSIIPSICLEILARRHGMKTVEISVEHYPYVKKRTGSLQSVNKKSLTMFWKALLEVIRL